MGALDDGTTVRLGEPKGDSKGRVSGVARVVDG